MEMNRQTDNLMWLWYSFEMVGEFGQQLKAIDLTADFNLEKCARIIQQHTNFIDQYHQGSTRKSCSPNQRFLEDSIYETKDKGATIDVAFQEQLRIKVQFDAQDDKELNSTENQITQERRKRKERQIWTEEKYQKLLLQFRNIHVGIQTKSLKSIASQMGFCTRTIQIKWSEYQRNKNLPSIAASLTSTTTRSRSMSTKTMFYAELIRQILAQNGLLTTTQIAKVINQHLRVNKSEFHKSQLSANTISRILKKANYSYQKIAFIPRMPGKQFTQKTIIEKRYLYCQLYKFFLQGRAQIIFIDQTQISLYLKRKFCWIIKDKERPSSVVIPKNKGSSISLLCVITRRGAAGWKTFQQTCNTESFSQTLTSTLKEMLKRVMEKANKNARKIIIMQNESAKKLQVMNLITTAQDRFQLFYLPPFSQVFNPIECFFRELKDRIKTKNWTNKKELLNATKEILDGFKTFTFRPYFDRVQAYIEEGRFKIKHNH